MIWTLPLTLTSASSDSSPIAGHPRLSCCRVSHHESNKYEDFDDNDNSNVSGRGDLDFASDADVCVFRLFTNSRASSDVSHHESNKYEDFDDNDNNDNSNVSGRGDLDFASDADVCVFRLFTNSRASSSV